METRRHSPPWSRNQTTSTMFSRLSQQSRYSKRPGGRRFGAHIDTRTDNNITHNTSGAAIQRQERPRTNPTGGQTISHTDTATRPHGEKTKERILTPLSPAQPFEEKIMSYPYSKYRDDSDAKAHVYAFLQMWKGNHVSQQLTDVHAEQSKITEFDMTLEGPATRWHAKHLPGRFATFETLKTKFL